MNPRFQDRFTLEEVEHGQTNRSVFVSKNEGKPIIILHELLGMNPAFVDYCLRMSRTRKRLQGLCPADV